MALNRFVYAAVVVLFFFLSVMYFEPLPVFFLLLLVIVPAVTFLAEWHVLWRVRAAFSPEELLCEAGEENEISIVLRNDAWLPASRLCLCLQMKNKISGRKKKHRLEVSVPAKSEVSVSFPADCGHCGTVELSLLWMRLIGSVPVYSWKRTIRTRKKSGRTPEAELIVIPKIQDLAMEISPQTRNYVVDWDSWEALHPGNDVSQIYQIRPFRPEDRLQHVHWKLSARLDEWMVKEFSRQEGPAVLILMDWQRESFSSLDWILEAASSLSFAMIMKHCKNLMASSFCMEGEWFAVEREEDFYLVMGQLMRRGKTKNGNGRQKALLEEQERKCGGIRFSHLYYVTDRKDLPFQTLLATSRIAERKTLVYTGENREQKTFASLEDWKVEVVGIGKQGRETLAQWNWIV